MKKLIILSFALLLGACSTWNEQILNPVNKNDFAVVESSYGIALSIAVAYYRLPLCEKVGGQQPCAERSVVIQLQKADAVAQVALQQAKDLIQNNPTLSATAAVTAAKAALATLQSIETQYGVK